MSKTKILLIEDNHSLEQAITSGLDTRVYEVELAVDAEQGKKKIKTEKPDLILLDIMLPGENGFALLKELKEDDTTKAIPVLILSNLGQEHEIQEGLALGASDYLVKADHSIAEIIKKIKELVGDSQE